MKRTCMIVVALLMIVALFGCAKTNPPSPTATPFISPSVSPLAPTGTPTDIGGNGTAGNAGGMDGDLLSIPGFTEGLEVEVSELPDIKSAVQDRYEGATINKITHSLQDGRQLYRIDFTDQDGKIDYIYIAPDGQIIPVTMNDNGTSATSPNP